MDKDKRIKWLQEMSNDSRKWKVEAEDIVADMKALIDSEGVNQQNASALQRLQGIVFLMDSAQLQFDKAARSLRKVKKGTEMDRKLIAKTLVKLAKDLTGGVMTNSVFSNKNDIEFLLNVTTGFMQIGMGGEWWAGQVKEGKNVFHHRKEKVDEAYKPVTVLMRSKGHDLVFDVMGGFYGDDGQTFEVKAV